MRENQRITGIYKITNKNNNKVYIGQSQDITLRWRQHKQNYQTMSGWYEEARAESTNIDDFTFEVIQECKKEELDELETYWISYYNSIKQGYNRELPTFGEQQRKGSKVLTYSNEVPFIKEEAINLIQSAGAHLNRVAFNLYLYCFFKAQEQNGEVYYFSRTEFRELWNISEQKTASLGEKELIEKGYLKKINDTKMEFDVKGKLNK